MHTIFLSFSNFNMLFLSHIAAFAGVVACAGAEPRAPPRPEPIFVTELPLPPVAPSDVEGSCSRQINPHRTGCIGVSSNLQGGNFLPDDQHIVASVNFTGAPADQANVYTGEQLILVKAGGNATFPNGDPWKCITCGVPDANKAGSSVLDQYPQAFKDGTRVLVGNNIVDCGSAQLSSPQCTPDKVHIYPLRMDNTKDGSGPGKQIRELRLHPDNVHIGLNAMNNIGEFAYFGRLSFNPSPTTGTPRSPRYDIVNVTTLFKPKAQPVSVNGSRLIIDRNAIDVGEFRGFSGSGKEITYVGFPAESSNIDLFAADLTTGKVRRLTTNPGYADPIDISSDDKWMVILDTRGTDRMTWLSGMREVPPLTDLITTSSVSSVRNNGQRRFLEPWLLDHDGDRGSYYGQKVSVHGNSNSGSVDDPMWNAGADPRWSHDGTRIAYYQRLVVPPACGGRNPLPCPNSTAPGGRVDRLMLAHLTSRKPIQPKLVPTASDVVPWGVPYVPGTPDPTRPTPSAGNYTLDGSNTGFGTVQIIDGSTGSIKTVAAQYHNLSDDGVRFLSGTERVTVSSAGGATVQVDWYSNLTSVGEGGVSTKKSSPGGFHLQIDILTNIFEANGTLATTVDGKVYKQPANGT